MLRAYRPLHYITLLVVLAASAAGGFAGYQRLAPSAAQAARLTTQEARRGNLVSTVSATGSVVAPTQAKLAFKSAGRLKELVVNVGDEVSEGQSLARLDGSDLELAVLQAQASHRSALAKLEQTQAGARPEELRASEAQVEAARVRVEQTRAAAGGPELVAAQAQLESAKLKLAQLISGARAEDLAAAQAQLSAAQAKLAALRDPRPEDLLVAQAQRESAKLKLAQLQNPRPDDLRSAEAQLASAQAKLAALRNPRPEDIAAAQAQVDTARTKLAQLLDAPKTRPEDVANAQLAVETARVGLEKALIDQATSKTLAPGAAEAAVRQAQINVEKAQNDLNKLLGQGASEWDLRLQQLAVEQAEANLAKLRNPTGADLAAAQAAVEQAQTTLEKLRSPAPADVQTAQVAVDQAQVNLDKLRHPSPADIATAGAAVEQAQATLSKLLSPSDFDVQVAEQAVIQAQANLDKLLTTNQYDLQSARASLKQAEANLDLKRAGATNADVLVAQAAVEQAQVQLEQARANLAGAMLVAPFTGLVAASGAQPGEQVGSNTAVVTLVDPISARVDVIVDETDVAKIQSGQRATITMEALSGQRLNGTVRVVAPTATVQQGVVNYQVQVALDRAQAVAAGVRPGMTATAQIVTASKADALVVPNRAVRTQGRARTVEVMVADGKTEQRQVQVGMTNDQLTEILEGVREGELVVIPTTTTATVRVPGFGGGFGGPPGGGFGGPPGAVQIRR